MEDVEEGVNLVVTRAVLAQHIENWNAARTDGMVAARVADVLELIEEFGKEMYGLSVDPPEMVMAMTCLKLTSWKRKKERVFTLPVPEPFYKD